jgi:hypothetical protein
MKPSPKTVLIVLSCLALGYLVGTFNPVRPAVDQYGDMQALVIRLRRAGLDFDSAWVCPSQRHQGGLYLKLPGDRRTFEELSDIEGPIRFGNPDRLKGIAILMPAGRFRQGGGARSDCCDQVGPWIVHADPELLARLRAALQ